MFDRSEGFLGEHRDEPRTSSAVPSTTATVSIRAYDSSPVLDSSTGVDGVNADDTDERESSA